MSNPAPTLNQINAFNATQGTTIDFNIIGGTEVIRSNKIYIYDLSDNSLICTHLYVSTESIHELPPNTSSSIVYASGKSSADFTNNTQYYAQIQTFTDVGGTQGGSGLSIAKLFWCLPTPTLTLSTIPTTISTTSYNVSATYTPNTSGGATNEIQEFQFNLYSAIGALLQTSGVVLYGEGVDLSYNFSGLEVDSTYYVTLDVTTTQGMNVSVQSNTFTVSIDTPTMGSASVVNNGCDGYISVTSNLSSEYEHEESVDSGEIMSFTTDSVNDITELDVDFSLVQNGIPWMSAQDTEPYMFRAVPTQTENFGYESDTIVGGTVGWNQKLGAVSASVPTVSEFTATRDIANNAITISGTMSSSRYCAARYTDSIAIQGHKYLMLFKVSDVSGLTPTLVWGKPSRADTTIEIPYNGSATYSVIRVANSSDYAVVGATYNTSGSAFSIKLSDLQTIDLTAYFGTAIADYVYTLESGTAGAGVAWLKENAPQLFEYHAYDAGSLESVSGLTSHDMVGFNAWDEEWESGDIDANGQNHNASARMRSKNYIPCMPNTTYYFHIDSKYNVSGWFGIYFYDTDKNMVGSVFPNVNRTFNSVADAHYMRFFIPDNWGAQTYNDGICINLSWDGERDGEYEEYVKHSYPLDSDLTLRGIPKLDASNNLYYDGDVYESDGSVTRKWGFYTIQSSDITLDDGGGYTNIVCAKIQNLPNMLKSNLKQAIHSKYGVAQVVWPFDDTSNIGKFANNPATQAFWFIFSVGTTIEQMRTALVGTTLVYEKATPTTETADPYTNPQIVDPHGTEEYVGSPIPVGHKTTYQRICPINGWDSVEVDVVGKNLFDDSTPVTYGQYLPAGIYSDNSARMMTDYVEIKSNIDYTAQVDVDRSAMLMFINYNYFDANKNWLGNRTTNGDTSLVGLRTKTFNISDARAKYIRLVVTSDPDGSTLTGRTFVGADMQIELGSIATTYTPYNGTTYTSTFPKYKQQVAQDKIPYITKNIGDTYADTLTENLVGGTIAWNQSVPDTTTTHTVSGSIASMNDAVAGNFESVVCDIEPRQDLHGYSSPWVGGAGKNKINANLGAGSINDLIYTNNNGIVTVSGTASANTYRTVGKFTPQNGVQYIMSGCPSGGANGKWRMTLGGYGYDYGSGYTFTGDGQEHTISCDVYTGAGNVNITFKPMIRLASETDATYEPYENLCPIYGYGDGAGRNKLPSGYAESKTQNGVTFTVNADGTVLANGTATSTFIFNLCDFGDLWSSGSYVVNGCPSGGGDGNFGLRIYKNVSGNANAYASDYGSGATFTGTTSLKCAIVIWSGKTLTNKLFEPMIRLASEQDATYEPYKYDGCKVNASGKNLYGGTYLDYWYLPLPQGTTVRVSSESDTRIAYYKADKTQVDYWSLTSANDHQKEFALSADTTYFRFYSSDGGNCQITLANESWDYEPFGQTYSVSWQDDAGTVYGGTVDVVSGVLTVDMASVDMGSLSWGYVGARFRASTPIDAQARKSGGIDAISSAYERATSGTTDGTFWVNNSNYSSTDFIVVFDARYTDPTAFKNAVTGQTIVYELATPTTYQLDPVQVACLLGQNNVWNTISNTSVTYPTNHSYQSLSTTRKYYKRINGVESISVGSDVVANVGTDNIIDLTQMFGTTIANYIYNREQSSSSGMGVKFFKSLFPNNDYDYNSGELISVNASAHVIKDANGNVVHTYPLDSDLVLRGVPKLDANNKLYYDGDVYNPNGSVTRKYGIVDLGTLNWSYDSSIPCFGVSFTSAKPTVDNNTIANIINAKYTAITMNALGASAGGVIAVSSGSYMRIKDTTYTNAASFKSAMSGVYLVYELATPTTEQADPFEENQTIIPNGIEEYFVTEQGDVEMPVGHDSTYYTTAIYGGTIDMAKGVLTINMVSVDLGDLTWSYYSNGDFFYSSSLTNLGKRPNDVIDIVSGITSSIYELAIDPTTGQIAQYNMPDSRWNNVETGSIAWHQSALTNQLYVYVKDTRYTSATTFKKAVTGSKLVYELATPIEISLTPQQMQTLSGQNNIWSNTNGGMSLVYQLPITALLVKRRDVADVSGKWLTLYSIPITQASDMDFTFIDFLNQYGKTYQYALVPVLAQDQSGVVVQIEGGYTVSDNVDSIFDGVYIADQTNVERVKAGVGYGNIDMNQGVGSITPIGSKYPIVITNSQNQYHNGSIRGTIVPNDFYSNGNLSRMDMVNKRDELEQFLTNKRAKIIKDWNGKMWLVMIMSNVSCSFDDNYGMGMVSFSADWLEVGDPTNQQDLYNAGLINVGGV